MYRGSGGRAVERWTVNRGDGCSTPPSAVSKPRQFHSPHICLFLLEDTLKAGLCLFCSGLVHLSVYSQVIAYRNIGTVEGLAVDWIAKNIYWTDAQKVRVL